MLLTRITRWENHRRRSSVPFTCGGEEQREQGVMSCGGQDQEDPSILSVLHGQDAAGTNGQNV